MAKGWLIGVMVEIADEPAAVRHFFAAGLEDRATAEWRSIDGALRLGPVAASPVGGMEPVHAIGELTARTIEAHGLRPGEIRPLGRRAPRQWATVERPMQT